MADATLLFHFPRALRSHHRVGMGIAARRATGVPAARGDVERRLLLRGGRRAVGGDVHHFAMHAFTLALLAAASLLYAAGVRRLWARAGRRGISLAHVGAFAAGMLMLALAVVSPLHELAERFLWVHMIQHELLMVIAAPLLVLGRPLQAFVWVRPVHIPRWLSDPLLAWTLHAAAIWLWHAPHIFEAAVTNEALHFAQHASFLGTAILFWWTVLARAELGAIASLFTTMLHTGALGALMTFSRYSWYAGYGLEDQQLAGLVMWVPAGLAYPIVALLVGSRWLRRFAA